MAAEDEDDTGVIPPHVLALGNEIIARVTDLAPLTDDIHSSDYGTMFIYFKDSTLILGACTVSDDLVQSNPQRIYALLNIRRAPRKSLEWRDAVSSVFSICEAIAPSDKVTFSDKVVSQVQ